MEYDFLNNALKMYDLWATDGRKFPLVDILENDEYFSLEAELPGFSIEDINVEVENKILCISSSYEEKERDNYIMRERRIRNFSRKFTLPSSIDESKIEGSFKNGILVIKVPKIAKPEPKKINVKLS